MPDPADNSFTILCFGAGAIGTYIGGSLALQGHTVVFLELPEVAAQLRTSGLRLSFDDGEKRIPDPQMVTSLAEGLTRGPFDLAIFALKSFDTQAVLKSLSPLIDSLPPILCLQNGVDNEPALAAVLGQDKVIAGTITSSIGRRGPGDIVLERLRGVGVDAGHPISPSLVDAMTSAGLNARLYSNAPNMKWSKLLTNLLANATSAILNMTPGEIFAHSRLYRLEINQLRETLGVMAAQRIHPVNLPGTPVRLLAFCVRSLPPALSQPILRRVLSGGRGGKMPSFHLDLHSGRGKSEVDYLNGAVVRHGERLGIPTPVNRMLNTTLLALTSREQSLDTYAGQPEKLLALLETGL